MGSYLWEARAEVTRVHLALGGQDHRCHTWEEMKCEGAEEERTQGMSLG